MIKFMKNLTILIVIYFTTTLDIGCYDNDNVNERKKGSGETFTDEDYFDPFVSYTELRNYCIEAVYCWQEIGGHEDDYNFIICMRALDDLTCYDKINYVKCNTLCVEKYCVDEDMRHRCSYECVLQYCSVGPG